MTERPYVVIVEREIDFQDILKYNIERHLEECETVTYESGRQALAEANNTYKGECVGIVGDLNAWNEGMFNSDLDIGAAIKGIKELAKSHNARTTIALTGRELTEISDEGITHLMKKPLSPRELVEKLKTPSKPLKAAN